MSKIPFILLIHESAADIEAIREALSEREGFRLQCLARPQTALVRIAGGGVDAMVVHWASAGNAELECLLKIKSAYPRLPLVVVYDPEGPCSVDVTSRLKAAATLTKRECERELTGLIRRLIENYDPGLASVPHRKTAPVLSIVGVKGGVG